MLCACIYVGLCMDLCRSVHVLCMYLCRSVHILCMYLCRSVHVVFMYLGLCNVHALCNVHGSSMYLYRFVHLLCILMLQGFQGASRTSSSNYNKRLYVDFL